MTQSLSELHVYYIPTTAKKSTTKEEIIMSNNFSFSWDFDITDMREQVKAAAKEQILKGLVRIGKKMQEYAAKLCPVDTGALRDTIAFKIEPDEQAAYVGSNSEYATYVELGTGQYSEVGGTPKKRWTYRDELTGETRISGGQKPQHFIKPAVADHIETFKAILEDALSHD